MTTTTVKAKVLDYKVFYHGIFGGKAKVKLLDGEDKGKVLTVQTVGHHKPGEVINLYATANDD